MYVSVQHTLRAMRLTAMILTACCLSAAAGTRSQSNITYSGKNVKLENVFQAVKQQTGYIFFYDNATIAKTKPVTVEAKNLPLAEFMELVLRGQELTWLVENTTILIQKKKQEQKSDGNRQPNATTITGIIRGPDGKPLQGISVMIKGTARGTITDNEGRFRIAVNDENAVLIISAANIETKEVLIKGRNNLESITVNIKIGELEEVVVNKGYYTEKQKLSTSNVVTVKATDIEKQPVQNPLLALQARVPGLFITQPSGLSGAGIKVRIQGQNSIANGNDPLYVVDGVPIDAQLPRTGLDYVLSSDGVSFSGWGNPLNYINPSDIERIDVLKDADATAIYGSRAANGAILITTKKGKAGSMKLDVNMQTGWGKMTRRLEMMNTRQYLDMRYEAFKNDDIDWRSSSVSANDLKVWDTTSYTNWQDQLLGGTAHYADINTSVSGGSSNIRYLVSGTYHRENTVFPFPEFADQKTSVHFNLDANNSNQKLRMQFSGNYMFDDNKLPQSDITSSAVRMEPNAPPLLNADGSINWAPDASGNTTVGGSDVNVMILRYQKYVNKTRNLVSSLKIDYNVLPGFNVGASAGYNHMQTNDYSPDPLIAYPPEERERGTAKRSAAFGERTIQSWIIEPQGSYRTKINRGSLDVLVGSTFQEGTATANSITADGQLSDEMLDDINSAARIMPNIKGSASAYRYNALFSRINYNYDDRYIVNLNARRDGSTRFGDDNRFHNFWSVGTAWIFSGEKFFKQYASFVSFGKLRGSYGITGNDKIGDYKFMSLYDVRTSSVSYQGIAGLYPQGLPNPGLQWEETRKLQVGFDLGFFRDKLMFNATFVRNRSSNQLLEYALPIQAGFSSYQANFPATIQNRSWELIMTGKIIQSKNVNWTSSVNLTLPQNKLVEFPDLANSTYSKTLHVGAPMDVLGVFHWLGVAPGTGDYLFADKKGNPTITPKSREDNTVLISGFPKLYGGFENTISFEGFELNFTFQFVQQTGNNDVAIFNGTSAGWFPGRFSAGVSNQPAMVLDRWQKPGDQNKSVARYSTTKPLYVLGSDRRFTDVSYIRLKNVALSWDVPQQWLVKSDLNNLRVFFHGQNLLTFTNYKGLDPEAQNFSLPPLQVCTVGIKLGL